LMRQLGAQAVFVGSGIFKSESPERYAQAIVKATNHYDNPEILAEVSAGLGEPLRALELGEIPLEERLAVRGWSTDRSRHCSPGYARGWGVMRSGARCRRS